MKDYVFLALALLIFTIGAVFVIDSATYALYADDPSTGRPHGCYTILDRALGSRVPSEGGILTGTRAVELFVGTSLLLLAIWFFFRSLPRTVLELPSLVLLGMLAYYAIAKTAVVAIAFFCAILFVAAAIVSAIAGLPLARLTTLVRSLRAAGYASLISFGTAVVLGVFRIELSQKPAEVIAAAIVPPAIAVLAAEVLRIRIVG